MAIVNLYAEVDALSLGIGEVYGMDLIMQVVSTDAFCSERSWTDRLECYYIIVSRRVASTKLVPVVCI